MTAKRRGRLGPSSAPRSSATVGRPVARHAGHAAASPTRTAIATSAAPSTGSSAAPGGCSLSASSSWVLGPVAASAPAPRPIAPARSPTSAAAIPYSAATAVRETPIARWMPIVCRRRWTSALAPAASMTPAAARATSEKATSSAMTTPAAESIRTRTPERVRKRTSAIPVLVARACWSRTSTAFGSLAQISAWLTTKWRPGGSRAIRSIQALET